MIDILRGRRADPTRIERHSSSFPDESILLSIPVKTMTSISVSPPYTPPAQAPQGIAPKVASSPWVWMIVACLFLGISGGLRLWREWQFASLAESSSAPPFRLEELPRDLGDWQSTKENDSQLDPEVARIAGSKDSIIRTYLDRKSGDQMSALVLYGPSYWVFAHSPDACYPAAGYQLVRGPKDRELHVPGVKAPVHYRWAIYMKRIGGVGHYVETYHCFYYKNEWLPDASDQWKTFRYHPSMFKIQLARDVTGLSEEVHAPSELVLGDFIREISDRLSGQHTDGPSGSSPIPALPVSEDSAKTPPAASK